MMNVTIKEQYNQSSHDMCKKHNDKLDRELLRTCPSKLSKRDLEDLYIAIFDNNLKLKRTINTLQDNNKLLNTKIQRMTAAQKSVIGKERDCCSTTKAMLQEQRDTIADLEKVNERMSEKIRVLNMRLCSAKQFLRRSPSQTAWRGIKAPLSSLKNSSVSVLNTKESAYSHKTVAATQYIPLEKEAISTRTVETETSDLDKENSVRECMENKCKTLMEELRQKIVDLQEELKNCHEKYSTRVYHLESEMKTLHNEKQQVLATSSLDLQQRSQRLERLAAELRTASAHCNELEAQLLIERCKVSELETRLRAVDISNQIVKTVESRLNIVHEGKKTPIKVKSPLPKDELISPGLDLSSSSPHDWNESSPRLDVPRPAPRRRLSPTTARSDDGGSKHSDDSGYTDGKTSEVDSDKALVKVNQDLMKKIMDLQNQLDALRVANAGKTKSDLTTNNVDDCTTLVEGTGQDYRKSIEGDCTSKELQKGDCRHSTSKEASPDRIGNCPKLSEKTQELNKMKELCDSYDASFNKKILEENGIQAKIEEKIYITTIETDLKQKKPTLKTQKSLTKSDKPEPIPVDIPEDKTKKESLKNIKGSYDKIRDVVNKKLRKVSSQEDKSARRNVSKFGSKPDVLANDRDLSEGLYNAGHSNAPLGEEKKIQPSGVQTDVNPRSPASECDTYTIHNNVGASRAASPDNTDHEISSITDLPSERDGVSPRTPLSPGEEKPISTYTESYTETYTEHTNTTDAGSLSEGELPIRYANRKPSNEYMDVRTARTNPVPVAQKMEAALQSIGEELARCRSLLDSRRPQEVTYSSM